MPKKIAFVSCAYSTFRKQQPAWKEIRDANPDLLLMLGDNAYMAWDGDPALNWAPQDLERCYEELFKQPHFRWLSENVPTLAIWDDHDTGPNDTYGAMLPAEKLKEVREKFDRWMGFAKNDNPPHMYCTYLGIPDVKIVMLDVRSYRTPFNVTKASLLGEQQERWLWKELDEQRTQQRKITIVCSGTGFTHGAPRQTVQDYQQFADLLKQRLAFRPGGDNDVGRRSLFLAGDIHQNEFATLGDVGVHEALSSGVACFPTSTYVVDENTEKDRRIDKWGLLTIGADTVEFDFHGWTKRSSKLGSEPLHVSIGIDDWKVRKHVVGPPPAGG